MTTARRGPAVEAALLQSLGRVAVAAARSPKGPAAAARQAVAEVTSLLGVDGAAVFTHDPAAGLLQPLAETRSRFRERPVPPGEGAIGRAFTERRPVLIEDYATWAGAMPEVLPRGMVAGAVVPLLSEDDAIGTLGVWTYAERHFTALDLETLKLFAAHLAPLLEGALRRQETLEQTRELRALHELAVAAAAETDPARIAEIVGRRACELMDMEVYSVARWDTGAARLAVIHTNFPGWDGRPVTMDETGAVAMAFARGAPVAIEDYRRHPQRTRVAGTDALRSVLAVPLLYEDQRVGAIALATGRQRKFPAAQTELLSLLAAQIAPRFH